jgi:predicted nucleic acid-binding protein
MVLFDAGILIKLLDARTPDSQRAKLDYLIAELQKTKIKILIPTPALAEFYVKADPEVIANFKGKSAFIIASFDEKAALECSISIADAIRAGDKKASQPDAGWQKIKFDHQIAAIAKCNRAITIYSEDVGLRRFAERLGMRALSIEDLPDDPASVQQKLDL